MCHILLTTYGRMTRVFKEMMPTWDPLVSFKRIDHFPEAKWLGVWIYSVHVLTAFDHPSPGTKFLKVPKGFREKLQPLFCAVVTPFCFF